MKIQQILPYKAPKQNFKGEIIQFPKNGVQKNKNTSSPVNPDYFQSLYGIEAPSVYFSNKLPNGLEYMIELDEEYLAKYLCDKNGELIPANVKLFAYFNAQFAKILTSRDEFSQDEIPEEAVTRTIRFFQLSKNDKGYDFTDFIKKYDIIARVVELGENAFDTEDEDSAFDEIISAAKLKTGKLDYKLINQALDMIESSSEFQSPGKVIELLKYYYSLDTDNKDAIYKQAYKLNQTYFAIGKDDEVFENVMDLCFDNNSKFDPQRADILLKAIEVIEKWIDRKMYSKEFDKRGPELMERYVSAAIGLLTDYFDFIQDKRGRLLNDIPSFDEFMGKNIKPSNPSCISFSSNISFTSNEYLKASFNLPNNMYAQFDFEESTIKNYLLDKEGNIDTELVKKYSTMLANEYIKLQRDIQEELDYFSGLYEKEKVNQKGKRSTSDEEAEELYLAQYSSCRRVSEFEALKNYVSKLSGDTKVYQIEEIIGALKTRQKYLFDTVYYMTEKVFQFSKTNTGYDFSDINEKYNLVEHILQYNRHFGLDDNDERAYDDVLKNTKENGKIDYYLAHTALDMIISSGYVMNLEFAINTLKHFYQKDPDNVKMITSIAKELHRALFMLNEENNHFQDLMELCFDENNRYNPIKGEVLCVANRCFTDWTAQKLNSCIAR